MVEGGWPELSPELLFGCPPNIPVGLVALLKNVLRDKA